MFTRVGVCIAKDRAHIFKLFTHEDVVVAQQLAIDWINSIKHPDDVAMVVWVSELIPMLPQDRTASQAFSAAFSSNRELPFTLSKVCVLARLPFNRAM